MKVGLVDIIGTTVGGITRYTNTLFSEIRSLLPEGDVQLLHPPKVRSPILSSSLGLIHLGKNYDLLHFTAHPTTPFFLLTGSKNIITIHSIEQYFMPDNLQFSPASRRYRRLNFASIKYLQRYVAAFVTVSAITKINLIKFLKIPEPKIHVIPHGVNHEVFKPPEKPDQAKKDLGKAFGIQAPYLLHVSHHQPLKNIPLLIKAFAAALKNSASNTLRLVIAGEPGRDEPQIQEAIQTTGLEKRIDRLGPIHDDLLLAKLYAGADAFLFPSLYESFGLPVLEAMACGTPVITAKVGGIPEIGGESCLYVNPLSLDELTNAILSLFKNKTLREALQEKGLRQAAPFTWRQSAEKHLRLYESLIKI